MIHAVLVFGVADHYKCLRVSLRKGRPTHEDFGDLIHKVCALIFSCGSRALSFVERITLVKSV